MNDQILISGLQCYGFHGASNEEQVVGHRYLADLELKVDLGAASSSDSLDDTVDYGLVAKVVRDAIEATQFRLLEALSAEIIQRIFQAFPKVLAVHLKLCKQLPPMPFIVDYVGVEIFRER